MAKLAALAAIGSGEFNRLLSLFPQVLILLSLVRGCPAGANGNLQCCKIPSFHSANDQPNLEYFQSAYVPELSFPPAQGSILEQQQPSEQAGSANALNGLNQYFESAQVPAGESGSNLNSPAEPVTGNSLIGYNGYGAPAAAPDPWTEAWDNGFDWGQKEWGDAWWRELLIIRLWS